jgi:hypothetical protein
VSELEHSSPDRLHSFEREDEVGALGERSATERAGLPQSYRMRADAHYVDQIESRYEGPPIRLMPARQIEIAGPSPSDNLEALTRSIAAHGMLQPLLVNRHNGGYRLIAGRRRLAAAIDLGLTDVPCLTYEIEEAEAMALARADNLRDSVPSDQPRPSSDADRSHEVLRALAVELTQLVGSAALLRHTPHTAFPHRVAADLVQAQAWRAAWLASAAAVVARQHRESRMKPIGVIFDRVRAGFEPEARLTSLQLDCSVSSSAAGVTFDEDLGVVAVSACVFATLSWMDGFEGPRVEVRADAPTSRMLKIEVAQRSIPVPPDAAGCLTDPESRRSGDLRAVIALLAVKSLAVQHGGTVEVSFMGGRGSLIQSAFCQA